MGLASFNFPALLSLVLDGSKGVTFSGMHPAGPGDNANTCLLLASYFIFSTPLFWGFCGALANTCSTHRRASYHPWAPRGVRSWDRLCRVSMPLSSRCGVMRRTWGKIGDRERIVCTAVWAGCDAVQQYVKM